MTFTSWKNKQRGALNIDLLLYLAGAIGLLVLVFMLYPQSSAPKKLGQFQTDAQTIVAAVDRWKKARSNYTGVSISVLCAQNILTKGGTICGSANTGTSTNSYGGNWTVTAASNPGLYTITGTLPNDPDSVAELADAMAPTTRDRCQTATSCATLTTTTTSVTMTY